VALVAVQTELVVELELLVRELMVVLETATHKILALVEEVVLRGGKLPAEEVVEPT
jgi:hypothetical protein